MMTSITQISNGCQLFAEALGVQETQKNLREFHYVFISSGNFIKALKDSENVTEAIEA